MCKCLQDIMKLEIINTALTITYPNIVTYPQLSTACDFLITLLQKLFKHSCTESFAVHM